jgi:hypothetical protein
MKIGAVALAAIALIVAGSLLYGVADLKFGGWLAMVGVFLALGAILAAQIWSWTHDDEFR